MLEYNEYDSLVAGGMTGEEAHAALRSKTVNPILIADLENFLTWEGLASRNPVSGQWQGPLVDEINNNAYGLAAGLTELFSHINKPRSVTIGTDHVAWAWKAEQLLAGCELAGLITPDQHTRFHNLGGGLAGNVPADHNSFLTQKQAHNDAVAYADLKADMEATFWSHYNASVVPELDGGNVTKEGMIAALRAMADNWEAE